MDLRALAVGMATDIPPHNLTEVGNACLHLLDNPDASTKELLDIIKGPDFPLGGKLIATKEELYEIYESGRGGFKIQATYTKQDDTIVIDSLPYQSQTSKTLMQIADVIKQKKLPIIDIHDESDEDQIVKIILTGKSNRLPADEIMATLFNYTDLEKTAKSELKLYRA